MKFKYSLVSFMMLLSCIVYAQHTELIESNFNNTTKRHRISVGISGGIKYFTSKDDYLNSLKEYKTSPSIVLNIGINPFKKNEHVIGLEFLAYKYGKSKDKFIENVFGLNIYYRRLFFSMNDIFFFPQASLTMLSNDPALMLSTSVDLGIGYSIDRLEILLRNSFRFNIFTLQKVPSILLLGISIKI